MVEGKNFYKNNEEITLFTRWELSLYRVVASIVVGGTGRDSYKFSWLVELATLGACWQKHRLYEKDQWQGLTYFGYTILILCNGDGLFRWWTFGDFLFRKFIFFRLSINTFKRVNRWSEREREKSRSNKPITRAKWSVADSSPSQALEEKKQTDLDRIDFLLIIYFFVNTRRQLSCCVKLRISSFAAVNCSWRFADDISSVDSVFSSIINQCKNQDEFRQVRSMVKSSHTWK